MKTIDAGEQILLSRGMATLASGLKLVRRDGLTLGFTSHNRDRTVDGQLYEAGPGLMLTSLSGAEGFAVDDQELSTLDDGSVFSTAEIFNGLWRGARFWIIRYNWVTGVLVETLMAGTLGEISVRRSTLVIELRGLQQYLQQGIGALSTKTCRNRLGDARCGLDLAPFTFTGTVTSSAGNATFTASGLTQDPDYFGEGLIEWLTGGNAGMQSKVRTHATGGVITMCFPGFAPIEVGDTFEIVAGCRKRLQEDCRDKFDRVLFFRGEPHRGSIDQLTKPPRPSV